MDRYWEANPSKTAPTPPTSNAGGYPTDGNPATVTPPSTPGQWWYHQVTEEIRNAIVKLGGVPDFTQVNQLATYISQAITSSGNAITSSLAKVATTGQYSDLLGKPTIPAAQVNSDWNASSGIAAILNKPAIPAAQVNADWNASSGVAAILNKPSIQPPLGFTPVQQGGGSNMGTNKIYLGWDGSELLAQVDGSPQGYVWTSGNAPSGIGQSGWHRFPSGLYLQWGMTPVINTDGTPTYNFPVAFPSAGFGIVATQQYTGITNGSQYSMGAQVRSNSTFSISVDQGPSGGSTVFWIALGV